MIVPEMPARAATTEAIVGALEAALADEPKWAFALDLAPETIEERAAAEHRVCRRAVRRRRDPRRGRGGVRRHGRERAREV